MRKFWFSRGAEADLLGIGDYTVHQWGTNQASSYLDELEACCQMLAENPGLGRPCDDIRPGLRRHEHGEHVVFYRIRRSGVLISRILHRRMLPERHAMDDDDKP